MPRKLIIGLLLMVLSFCFAQASHIRSGEVTAIRISQTSLRYRFTVVIYRDTDGVDVDGTFNTGDGRFVAAGRVAMEALSINGVQETNLGNSTSRIEIQFDYTYLTEGDYTVSYTENARNSGIINLGGLASGQFPFHVETRLRVSNTFINSSPQLTVPPLDQACLGSRFVHVSGAFDPDGDSLAFRLVTPLSSFNQPIASYLPLDDPSISTMKEDLSTPAIYTIDPRRGALRWDAPEFIGEYSIAFVIEEWRFNESLGQSELIGYVTRDMQIVVADCSDERPELDAPNDTCIVAGAFIESILGGSDPNGDQILMEAFGGVFEASSSPAEYLNFPDTNSSDRFRDSPAQSVFRWQTNLSHVQAQPHEVVFKITDIQLDPSVPSLVNFNTMSIQVVAPAPTGLTGEIQSSNAINLRWDSYIGESFNPTLKLYRRVGSFDFQPTDCNTGIPDGAGYSLIAELSANQTNYLDNDNIRPGVNYCYRLVAEFPAPKGGISYASNEFCQVINVDTPRMTNASVIETSDSNGEVFVKWTSPIGINETLFPGPFRYELFRNDNLNGTTNRTFLISTNDTTFNDIGSNTQDIALNYYVRFYDVDDNLVDSSATASSPRLETTSEVESIVLNWASDVPWSNQSQSFPYHYVYRNRTDEDANNEVDFVLIDSVNVLQAGFRFTDAGTFNNFPLKTDRAYCYFVTLQGEYENLSIDHPLLNKSQVSCATAMIKPRPGAPVILIENDSSLIIGPKGNELLVVEKDECNNAVFQSCNALSLSNTINWVNIGSEAEIVSYNVYFSQTGDPDAYELLANTPFKTFEHDLLSEYKGCYKVSAIDTRGFESERSQAICFDNCPYYELPNTFTPNGDNLNDTFRAFDLPNSQCSRFVKSVDFKVYDRWGGKTIYQSKSSDGENGAFIDWSGNDTNNRPLPSGTYYFTATVVFNTLNSADRKQEFKNWVKIIR